MKKVLMAAVILGSCLCASAETTFRLPADFLTEISRSAQFKTNLSFFKRMLVNQVVRNSSVNGIKLKDYNVDALMNYFNEDNLFKKLGSNKLVEPNTGATLEFNSDNKCRENNCTITIDFNGNKGPNEVWSQSDSPKDRIVFILRRTGDGGLDVVFPEFIN